MLRPQFSLKTMLWLMLVAAAFLGGIRVERANKPDLPLRVAPMFQAQAVGEVYMDAVQLRDGTVWQRTWELSPNYKQPPGRTMPSPPPTQY